MNCLLCNTKIDEEIIKWEESVSGESFKEGYCSSQCKETDGIITEFNIQAGLQKKSKVYDKTAVHKLMEDMAIENKLPPLSTDEIEKRIKMQELAKRKKDENADGSTSEEDFDNQAFGD